MNFLFILTSIGFFLWAIRSILFWTSLWQVKEYRVDRLVVHLRETIQGRWIVFSPFFIINFLLILLYCGAIISDSFGSIYQVMIFVYFVIAGLYFIQEIIGMKFKRPVRTPKAIAIFLLSLSFVIVGYIFVLTDKFLWLLIVQLLTPIFVSIFVFGFSFPTELYRDYLVQKAKHKLDQHKKLLVIGVSGSVGKTSTKEYLAHILSQNFSVVKTPLSNNTPIAIAKTILHKITDKTQIFIVEMGSYKKGEVKELCDIVTPTISITTSLGEQHISLYGSMKNIIETEKELLHALPKNGLALFNANSEYMDTLIVTTKKKKILYATDNVKRKKGVDILASGITVEKNGISFEVTVGGQQQTFHTPLLGKHNIENILPAIYLAHYLGVSSEKIKKAVATLQPLHKTMKKFTTQDGVILIDDTFNASPESVIAASEYVKVYTKKKIFVLMPLIELGRKAREHHYDIGKELAFCDYVFLTNKNFMKDITKGIQDKKGRTHIIVSSSEKIAQKISEVARHGDVVLFEGKEAGNVLEKLI